MTPPTASIRARPVSAKRGISRVSTHRSSQFEGEADLTVVEYFVACDEHVGLIHMSVNAQVAEKRKNDLPDPALVKALLDKSVTRLKQTDFRTPD